MFSRLSNKLTLILLGLLVLLSTSFIGFAIWSTPLFLQELNQQLNLDLANNIVKEKKLIVNNQVNKKALNSVFMGMMVVNPIIEAYLVDINGKLIGWHAPEGSIKRKHVDIGPIKKFIHRGESSTILGNDPRDMNRDKVFSAAEIKQNGKLQGYLYVVLGGQAHDSVVAMLESSYMLRIWIGTIIISLLIAVIAGFFIFRLITQRLGKLTESMEQFKRGGFKAPVILAKDFDGRPGDEIDLLGSTFREMSERIIQQLKVMEHNDASRRELVANVSHDLRTPLASMQGYLETLVQKGDQLSNADKQNYIDIAWKQSKRLQKLISELFELSTLEHRDAQLHFEPFSMSELVQDVSQKFQLYAKEKNLVLSTHLPGGPAFVSADIGLIQRVLENLIENAIKYTPAGGHIGISLSNGRETVATKVEDSGQGISGDELPHIFDRFYRVDKHRNEEGTGLGLAIARRIMKLHNSNIDVSSQMDNGTSFSFQLPSTEIRAL